MGWHVGMNAGSTALALLGVATTMVGIMLPSTVLTYVASQWGHRNRDLHAVRAFKQGMAPIVVALLLSTAWILAAGGDNTNWRLWLLAGVTAIVIWRTRLHLLWMLGLGALLGALQIV
jgi:chromate transporter